MLLASYERSYSRPRGKLGAIRTLATSHSINWHTYTRAEKAQSMSYTEHWKKLKHMYSALTLGKVVQFCAKSLLYWVLGHAMLLRLRLFTQWLEWSTKNYRWAGSSCWTCAIRQFESLLEWCWMTDRSPCVNSSALLDADWPIFRICCKQAVDVADMTDTFGPRSAQ